MEGQGSGLLLRRTAEPNFICQILMAQIYQILFTNKHLLVD